MKHDAYPIYRKSTVQWLGDVPEHWEVKRLKFILAEPLKYGANEAAELDDRGLPRYVRITDIDENDALREETFRSVPAEIATPYLLRDGDLLFARSGATSGKSFLYRDSWGTCAYAGYLIRARLSKAAVVPSFVRYFTASHSYWQWLSSAFIQATIQNVSAERYSDLRLTIPPIEEQRAIAAYLDRATARIDALLEKKRRFIELLEEKRAALITQAVTRGLDPSVAMKDTGVLWLGRVPLHWQVKPLKYVAEFINGAAFKPDEWCESGVPIVRIENLNGGEGFNFLQGEIASKYHVAKGDILFGWSGNRGTSFGPFIWGKEGLHYLNQHIFRVTGFQGDKQWLYWMLRAVTFYVESEAHGIIGMVHVTKGKLGSIPVPLPPQSEQRAIANYLDQSTVNIDHLMRRSMEAIEHLSEYRSALITAAVTGRIDVREASAMG